MSEPPTAVTIVEYGHDEDPSERIISEAVYDTHEEALDAIDVLMEFWSFDSEQDPPKRIEVQRV